MRLWQMLAASSGGAAFSPSSLFGGGEFGGWYDPSDLSTLWQDTAGTTAVTTDGQTVARIDDKSGNGNHLTQATASARPTYRTSGGLHWLDFDGGDNLTSGTLGQTIMDSASGAVMACAAASDSTEAIYALVQEVAADNTPTGQYVVLFFDTRSSPKRSANFSPDTTSRLLDLDSEIDGAEKCFIFSHDGSVGNGYVDNSAVSGSLTTTANFAEATAIRLGTQSGVFNLDGKIYGAVMLDRELTTAERGNLNTWLSDKAGI